MSVITATGSPSGLEFSDGAAGPVLSDKTAAIPHPDGGLADLATAGALYALGAEIGIFGIGDEACEDGEDWQDQAVCAQSDPEAFFPEKGGSTREAKKVCRGCPVTAECLEYALVHDERFGIWGGLSERERRRMKRETGQ